MTRLLMALVVGTLTGAIWWSSVEPPAWSAVIIIALHAVGAVALERALHVAKIRGNTAFLAAWLVGTVAAPAALGPLHVAGLLGSKVGLVIDLGVILAATIAGAVLGHRADGDNRAGGLAGVGVVVALFAGVTAWGISAIPLPSQPTARQVTDNFPQRPVAVLGIDGADWQVLDPLLARGEIPVLAGLMAKGSHGVLRSMDPMASPVIWTSIFTGDVPTTHGLEDWLRSDARSRKVPTMWDIWGAHGRRTLTVNVPGSWPPPAALPGGTLLSGFPIPGLSAGDTGQLRGHIISSAGGSGAVPTTVPDRDGDSWVATMPLSTPELEPRRPGLLHPILVLFAREGVLPVAGQSLSLRATPSGESILLEGDFDGGPVSVSVADWSPWLSVTRPGITAWFKVHLLSVSADQVALFVSPPFQDPRSPRHEFAVGIEDRAPLLDDDGPYIVEGLGWTAHRDPRVAHLVPDLVLDTQAAQLRTAERLLDAQPVDLLSLVFTATDRLQHSYWSVHKPDAYDWQPPDTLDALDNPVEEAYRQADAGLGRLIAKMPFDTVIFIVSDHGADPADGKMDLGEAGHRSDGMWVAAGPGVAANPDRLELRVIDITPTILRCIGAPVAEDFDGNAVAAVCPTSGDREPVATYLGDPGTARDGAPVDDQQIDQIKALGYMED